MKKIYHMIWRLVIELSLPLALVIIWLLWSSRNPSFFSPPLDKIIKNTWDVLLGQHLVSDILPSVVRLIVGFVISAVVGIVVGIPLGLSRFAFRFMQPMIEFSRALPAPILFPLAIMLLGLGDTMQISVIVFGCVWPVLLNTIDGVRGLNSTVKDTIKVYKVNKFNYLVRIVLPSAMPAIVAGMRSSLSLAIILMVISEMVGGTDGLGYFTLQSQRSFGITDMWSGVIVLGILGYLLNSIFELLERRVLAWHIGYTKNLS